KPCGGVLLVGQPAEAAGKTPALSSESLRRWASDGRLEGAQVNEQAGVWLKLERGALPGAGSWTHQYADPGNTTCSDDQLVKCPLGVLWFGEPGPAPIANRHERSQSPLAMDGRLFIEGENVVMAYDSYNGLLLWKRELPGTPRILIPSSSGNFAMSKDSLFVALRDKCYRLDVATGDITQTYDVPKGDEQKMAYWDYMAYTKGLLYGSRSARQNVSNMVFAMNPNDGSVRWTYAGKEILPSSISMGDGKLFLIDRAVSDTVGVEAPKVMAKKKAESADMRTAVALDAMTGKVLWRRTVDVTGAGSGRYFQSLSSIYQNDVLVLFGIFIDGHHWKDFLAGDFEYRRIIALSGSDGNPIWSKNIGYRVRPIVVGDTLHAEPWAYSLYTGEQKTRTNPVTGRTEPWQFARPGHHCGAPAAAPHIMLARSYTLGYYDLDNDYGIMNFGGLRPGCWINFIPANGLLLMPESAAGCMCPFPNQCSVMFKHRETNRAWAQYSAVGSMTPVKHLAINLGAPGDRLDKAGTLWLAYPRGGGSLVLQLGLVLKGMTGAQGAFRHNPETAGIEGTESPWIFSSGYNGLSRCAVPLLSEENGEALYTVRLGFADPDNSERGQRVFDIKLQGKVVQKDFDVVAEAGGKNKAVTKEFKGIGVKDNLIIELVPKASQPSPPPASRISLPASHLPLLNSLEVIRENVLGIGCAVPSFMLSSAKREQSGEIKMANDTENQFDGTLRIDAPTGFKVTAEQTGVDLAPGAVAAVKIAASVADNVAAGKYQANVKLIRKDGTVECERQIQIEYLADRERIVAKAIADAHVMRSSPDTNAGNATTLNVDGGDATVGDNLHSIAFLKFRLAITGTPQSATLRLYNGDNPSGDSGRVCLVTEQWDENKITYSRRPEIGKQLAKIGRVAADQVVEIPLNINVRGMKELSLAIDPTSSDGIAYFSRESSKAPELIIELAGE
ncbi:DNRLRE domain-containing protein, partial [Candidatus Sumerlaeota bacterium]|nr:DNRLRE domain-containing protein [Candidatus Sumerlaeota bacterium]